MNKQLKNWYYPLMQYNRNIYILLLANFLIQFGTGIFMVMYNLYIKALGFPEQLNGSIISMTALASAIILIPSGIASDKIGRKKMLIIGTIFTGASFFIRVLLEQHLFLVLFAFTSGIFMAFIQVSIVPFLAENSSLKQRVTLFSYNAAIMMFASMLGNMFGGLSTDFFHWYYQEVVALKITLLIGASFLILAFIPLLFIKEERSVIRTKKQNSLLEQVKKNKTQISILIKFTLASLIIGLGSGLVVPYLNLFFRDRFHASNSTIGFTLSLGQFATAIAMLIGPWLVKKIGEVRSIVYLQLISIPFLLITGFTNIYILAVFGFLFRQAFMNGGNPLKQSLMMGMIDDNMKGLANSLQVMVFNLGWAIMGPISTNIVAKGGSYWGYTTVFIITALLYIISSIYFYFVFKNEV